jgi:hypothetical protein
MYLQEGASDLDVSVSGWGRVTYCCEHGVDLHVLWIESEEFF